MATAANDKYSPEENSVIFFRHIKRDLGIPTTKQAVKVVDNVLSHIQSTLDENQTREFVSILPGGLQLLAAKNIGTERAENKSFEHLDELADNVYNQDKKSGSRILHTEVQALNAVVVILRKLDKYLNLFSYKFLQPRLIHGLKQIPLEG